MTPTYDPALVVMSYVIATLASYVALNLAAQMSRASERAARYWLLGGAVTMGAGIWSMHFIGMLAFDLPIPTAYDLSRTLLSLLIAVALSGFALHTINRRELSHRRLLGSGTLMGIGIASMHYTGMAAMRVFPPIQYDSRLLAASVSIAIVASVVALWIAFSLRSVACERAVPMRIAGALVMGFAIAGMHYTGMAAASFDPASICISAPLQIDNVWLATAIACSVALLLSGTMLIPGSDQSQQAGEQRSLGIQIKLTAAFLVAAALVASFVVASVFVLIEGAERVAALDAEHVALALVQSRSENALVDPERTERYIMRVHEWDKRDLFVVDKARRIIADADRPEIGTVFPGDASDAVGKTLADGQPRTFVEMMQQPSRAARQFVSALRESPGDPQSPIVGAVILEYTQSRDALIAQARVIAYIVAAMGVAVVLLTAGLGLRAAAMITPPLLALKRGAAALAAGNYDARVDVRSNDEVGDVGTAFNRMAEDLEAVHLRLVENQRGLADRVAARTAELRYSEAEQRRLAGELRLITEHMPVGLCYVDRDMRYQYHNRRYAEVIGLADHQIDGNRLDEVVAPELYALIRDPIAKALAGQQVVFERRKVHDGDECGYVQTTLVPRVGMNGVVVGFYAMMQDISDRKRAEAELTRTNAELRKVNQQLQEAHVQLLHAEKMASIGQLASGVAHEINNPIGYVSSNLGTLGTYIEAIFALLERYQKASAKIEDARLRGELRAADDAADIGFLRDDVVNLLAESGEGLSRVKRIVQDLKNFSRSAGDEDWQWADLHQGMDSTLNIVWNELKYKAEVRKDYGDLPQVQCRPSQLNQVFMNMLVNGADAIARHGTIDLRTGVDGESVWIEFADTGAGIVPQNLARIFDPFFTTKAVGKGTGLGLALSYGIVQDHGGRIEVTSEVGKGTTFRVWLPIRQPVATAASSTPDQRAEAS